MYKHQCQQPYLDDLLQVFPGVLQGLHGEPGVGVDVHLEALYLLVQSCQLVEVCLGSTQRGLKLVVVLPQVLFKKSITLNYLRRLIL